MNCIRFRILILLKNFGSDRISNIHLSTNSESDRISDWYLLQKIWMRSDLRVSHFLNIVIGRGFVCTICTKIWIRLNFKLNILTNFRYDQYLVGSLYIYPLHCSIKRVFLHFIPNTISPCYPQIPIILASPWFRMKFEKWLKYVAGGAK